MREEETRDVVGFCNTVKKYMQQNSQLQSKIGDAYFYYEDNNLRAPILMLDEKKPRVSINRKDLELEARVLRMMMQHNIDPDKQKFEEDGIFLIYDIRYDIR